MSRRQRLAVACLVSVLATFPCALPAHAEVGSEAIRAQDVRLEPQYVDAAGTTIAYAELGDGPPLLLLNGTGSPMAEWDPRFLAALAGAHRVIVFDYPGLGLSGPAPGRWAFAAAADWVAQFADTVEPGRSIDVLGWSMGGFIAQQLAIRHPEHVHRLVLAATNPGGASTVLGPQWVQDIDSDPHYTIRSYLRTNYPRTAGAQAAGRAFVRRLTVAVNSGRYPQERVPARTYDAMVAAEDPWLASDANLTSLPAIDAPTLVITGAQDVVTPPANSRRIAREIPGSRLDLVPAAGHSFLFQEPDLAARTIGSFLDG